MLTVNTTAPEVGVLGHCTSPAPYLQKIRIKEITRSNSLVHSGPALYLLYGHFCTSLYFSTYVLVELVV